MLYAWGEKRGNCSYQSSNSICRNVPVCVWGVVCKPELKKKKKRKAASLKNSKTAVCGREREVKK